MHRRTSSLAAIAACAIAVPVALAAPAQALAPPHPHPLITDVAGDAKAGPNSFNKKDVDILSADITTNGATISFTIKTAGPVPLILGGPPPLYGVALQVANGVGVGSSLSPTEGTAQIRYGGCGQFDGCSYDTLDGALSVDRQNATATATYALADVNAIFLRNSPAGTAPLTTTSVVASASADAYDVVEVNQIPHRDGAVTYTPFTLGG